MADLLAVRAEPLTLKVDAEIRMNLRFAGGGGWLLFLRFRSVVVVIAAAASIVVPIRSNCDHTVNAARTRLQSSLDTRRRRIRIEGSQKRTVSKCVRQRRRRREGGKGGGAKVRTHMTKQLHQNDNSDGVFRVFLWNEPFA